MQVNIYPRQQPEGDELDLRVPASRGDDRVDVLVVSIHRKRLIVFGVFAAPLLVANMVLSNDYYPDLVFAPHLGCIFAQLWLCANCIVLNTQNALSRFAAGAAMTFAVCYSLTLVDHSGRYGSSLVHGCIAGLISQVLVCVVMRTFFGWRIALRGERVHQGKVQFSIRQVMIATLAVGVGLALIRPDASRFLEMLVFMFVAILATIAVCVPTQCLVLSDKRRLVYLLWIAQPLMCGPLVLILLLKFVLGFEDVSQLIRAALPTWLFGVSATLTLLLAMLVARGQGFRLVSHLTQQQSDTATLEIP